MAKWNHCMKKNKSDVCVANLEHNLQFTKLNCYNTKKFYYLKITRRAKAIITLNLEWCVLIVKPYQINLR